MNTEMMIKKLNDLKNKIIKDNGFEIYSDSENVFSIKDEIKKKIFLLLTQMGIKEITFQFTCDMNCEPENDESVLSESRLSNIEYRISDEDNSETLKDRVSEQIPIPQHRISELTKKYGAEVVDALYELCLAPAEVIADSAETNRLEGAITYKPMEMSIYLLIAIEEDQSEDFDDLVWSD